MARACSSRCYNSRSSAARCRCSCGGANHGSGLKISRVGGVSEDGEGASKRKRSEVNLGITPFRGEPATRIAELTFYYDTTRYKGFERDLYRFGAELGVNVVGINRAAGIWRGQLEPAAAVQLDGDEAACRELASRLGAKYHQDAIMIFTPSADGDNFYYTIGDIGIDEADVAIATLVAHGIEGARYVDGKLEIGDANGGLTRAALALSQTLGRQLVTTTGWLRFLEKGVAYEPRGKKS